LTNANLTTTKEHMTESWLALLHPAHFWWLPVLLTVCPVAFFFWSFRGGEAKSLSRSGHGHIVAVGLFMMLATAVFGWAVYLLGALIWWIAV
jgi:hypothetical protein